MGAPTSPTLTQDGGQITFGWSHTGTENRFEVLFRKTGSSDAYERAILASKSTFGSASPYSYVTGSRPGFTWLVRAYTTAGAVTSGVTADFTGSVEGTWLLPVVAGQVVSGERVFIGRDVAMRTRSQSRSESYVPSREDAIAQVGAFHLGFGTIDGYLPGSRYSLTADQWFKRLEDLITNQSRYDHVLYVTDRRRLKVEVYADLTDEAVYMDGDAWHVVVNYRQVG